VAASRGAAIADLVERRAESFAVAILARVREIARESAGKDAGSDHRRREARAFLVGPVDRLDRREGLVAGAAQGAQRLEGGENAERAVELAAARLRVEMTADADGRNVGALAGIAREHGAHLVDR